MEQAALDTGIPNVLGGVFEHESFLDTVVTRQADDEGVRVTEILWTDADDTTENSPVGQAFRMHDFIVQIYRTVSFDADASGDRKEVELLAEALLNLMLSNIRVNQIDGLVSNKIERIFPAKVSDVGVRQDEQGAGPFFFAATISFKIMERLSLMDY